jgi:VanZ family protein
MPASPSRTDRGLVLAIALTALTAILIGYGTLSPPGTAESGLPLTDKHLHALAFAALVLPMGWARPGWALGIAAAALTFGGAIELIQPMVGRTAEWGDFIADGVGCLLGLIPGQIRRLWTAQR